MKVADNSINSFDLGVGTPITYDPNGNITFQNQNNVSKTYQYYPGTNRLMNTSNNGGIKYKYDTNGNIIQSETKGSLGYDPFFNLTKQVTNAYSTTTFQYNGVDERVLKTNVHDGTTLQTLYIRGVEDYPLIEKEQGTKLYIYGPTGLIAVKQDSHFEYFLKDHLGSTRVVVKEDGSVTGHYDYLAFGSVMRSSNPGSVKYQYTGQEKDGETELQNYRARMYDSDLGRFYAIDPVNQFHSPYSYAGNNPVVYKDATGKVLPFIAVVAIGAVVGGGFNVVANWDHIHDFKDGAKFFGWGAVVGAGSVVGGAALAPVIGTGAIAGATMGATSGAVLSAGNVALGGGNGKSFGSQVLSGALIGGVYGRLIGRNIFLN